MLLPKAKLAGKATHLNMMGKGHHSLGREGGGKTLQKQEKKQYDTLPLELRGWHRGKPKETPFS